MVRLRALNFTASNTKKKKKKYYGMKRINCNNVYVWYNAFSYGSRPGKSCVPNLCYLYEHLRVITTLQERFDGIEKLTAVQNKHNLYKIE